MNIIKDEAAQSSAELVLLFGGVIAIVFIAIALYNYYLSGLGNAISGQDLNNVVSNISNNSNPNSLIYKFS